MMALMRICTLLLAFAPAHAFVAPRHHTKHHHTTHYRPLRAEKTSGGLRLLEWLPSQKVLVTTARWGWREIWRLMMSELAPQTADGAYARPAPQRGTGATPALDADGAYVLYAGNACPWCHRAKLAVAVRGAEALVRVVELDDDPAKARRGGWSFSAENPDPVFGAADLKGVYDELGLEGRCTAPLLVDASGGFVSNESGDIVRALVEYEGPGAASDADLRPEALRGAIDAWNDEIYESINNGVYRAGFATRQAPYERAVADVFAGLEAVDAALARTAFVAGDALSEADLRLLPTIERFDASYAPLFLRTTKTIRDDYPHIAAWKRRMRALPGVADTVDVAAAARSYYTSLFPLNPSGIVPVLVTD